MKFIYSLSTAVLSEKPQKFSTCQQPVATKLQNRSEAIQRTEKAQKHLIYLHSQDKNIICRFDYAVKFFSDHEKLGASSKISEKIWNNIQCYNLC